MDRLYTIMNDIDYYQRPRLKGMADKHPFTVKPLSWESYTDYRVKVLRYATDCMLDEPRCMQVLQSEPILKWRCS